MTTISLVHKMDMLWPCSYMLYTKNNFLILPGDFMEDGNPYC